MLSTPNALFVFEKEGHVDFKICCDLIQNIQEISEKGYRGLFNDFILLYPTTIIQRLQKSFNLEDLSVSWFQLPTEYINVIPKKIFATTFIELLRYHNTNKILDFEEIENIFGSVWHSDMKEGLEFFGFSIHVKPNHINTKDLIFEGFKIEIVSNNEDLDPIEESSKHFNQGILNKRDLEFIRKEIKSPVQLAGFQNGWYATLADTELFREFDSKDIKDNFKAILHNAILGKVGTTNSYPSLYYFPGNVPKLIYQNDVESNNKQFFSSFKTFLELSSFELFQSKPQ